MTDTVSQSNEISTVSAPLLGDVIAERQSTTPTPSRATPTTTTIGKPSGSGFFPEAPNPPQVAPPPKRIDPDAIKVTCTIVKADYPQTKTIAINGDGSFKKSNPPGLSSGLAQKLELRGTPLEVLSLLGGRLEKLKDTEVLIPAPFNYSGLSCVELRTQGELRPGSNFIARTHQFFPPDEGAALFFFDIDTKDFPPEIRAMVEAEGDLTAAYVKVFPALGTAARLSRMSASAGWRNRDTGRGYGDQAGQHRYYVVKDGREIGAFSQRLFNRLVLAGYGFTFVAENGAIYIRTIFDMPASRDTARLAYEADAVLADERLERVPEERKCRLTGAGLLDTDELPELSEDEKARLREIVDDLKRQAQPEAERKKASYRGERIKEYVAKGMTPQNAAATADAALNLVLTGDFSVRLDDGEVVTVAQMFADPDKYDGKTCADPIEPEYGSGKNLAKIYLKNGSPNIFSHAHGGIKYKLERLPADYGLTAVEAVDEGGTAAGPADEPIDLFGHSDRGELASPPPNALPPLIERWARDQARRKGTAMSFPAAAAITAVAAAIGTSLRIAVRERDDQWTEPAGLWTVLLAEPGSTKSEMIKVAWAPLKELEDEWRPVDEAKRAEWLRRSKSKPAKGEISPDLGPEPKPRRLTLDDVTMEAQIALHAANPKGLLRAPDELAGMLDKLGAYKKNGGGDRSNLLRLFDGDSVSVDRVGGTSVYAKTALMSLLAGTQPEKFRPIVLDLGSDGMLQRMNIVLGDSVDREAVDEAPDRAAATDYRSLVRHLATARYGKDNIVRMSLEAAIVLKQFHAKCKKLKKLPGASSAWVGHLQKWDKFSARILLTFHAITQWDFCGVVDPSEQVRKETADSAVAYCDFLLRHSLAFHESYLGSSAPASEARGFAGHLLAHPEISEFKVRDVYHARTHLKGAEKRKLLLASMEELSDASWIFEATAARDHHGPTQWRVNPKIHERFAEVGRRETIERARRQELIKIAGEERKRLVAPDKMSLRAFGTGRHDGLG